MINVNVVLQYSGPRPYQFAFVARKEDGSMLQSGSVYFSRCDNIASAKEEIKRELFNFHGVTADMVNFN